MADVPLNAPSSDRKSGGAARLFLISGLILFLELACIRWFPAHVLFLTFFTNTVLLACFLGMSLGCLASGHQRRYLAWTPILLVFAMLAATGVEVLSARLEKVIELGNQNSPEMVFFGADRHGGDIANFVIPVEVMGGFFFVAIALALVGPGQELGRALSRLPNRVQAYTVNILGSIAGIALFFLCSWAGLSPAWWFSLVAIGVGGFLYSRPLTGWHLIRGGLLAAVIVLAAASGLGSSDQERQESWSPYYRIDYFAAHKGIRVNLMGHQAMLSREATHPAYALPHLLNRDSGGKPFQDVLIVGAGSGNDVSRALEWGAQHIDAVEIDPVILNLGKKHHPDKPYADDRVTPYQGDGRNYLRSTEKKYDLIVFALIDSLVLHSSYSNIRLESYLFTKEAFDDVKRCLKPNGVFVMSNYFRQGWIVSRLHKSLSSSFDTDPLVLTLPYQAAIDPNESSEGFTIFIAGRPGSTDYLWDAFHSSDPKSKGESVLYWLNRERVPDPKSPNGFQQEPGEKDRDDWIQFGLAKVTVPQDLTVATDDWPFLYLRKPMIPDMSMRGAAIMGGLAVLLLLWFVPRRTVGANASLSAEARDVLNYWLRRSSDDAGSRFFDGRMFFLGAGFMLIETKAVVHMALLFGSTWMVNSVVFFAVLVMILLANLFVLKARPKVLWPWYIGLFAALGLNAVVPLDSFLGWGPTLQVTGSCLLVFAPILFAAAIFAISFGRTREADRAFGFNIAGAMLGGLAEYASMLVGFRYLEFVALGLYGLSALCMSRAGVTAKPRSAKEINEASELSRIKGEALTGSRAGV